MYTFIFQMSYQLKNTQYNKIYSEIKISTWYNAKHVSHSHNSYVYLIISYIYKCFIIIIINYQLLK